MNKFKNYIWMAAGFAVLAAVISGITAAPAIAQAVKYALIQSRDEPARQSFFIPGSFGTVPAGKRYAIEHFFERCVVTPPGSSMVDVWLSVNTPGGAKEAYAVAHFAGPNGSSIEYAADGMTRLYVNAGETWGLVANGNSVSTTFGACVSGVSGYSIDLP